MINENKIQEYEMMKPSGLEKISEHQKLSGVAELFHFYNVTICELLASKVLNHSDMTLDYIEVRRVLFNE